MQSVLREATFDARGDLRGVFMKTTVDYSWELDAAVRSDVKVRPWIGLLAAADVRYLGVDGSQNRGNQTGYKIEGESGLKVARGRSSSLSPANAESTLIRSR